MNTFANLLPSVGGNRPPLSDEELRRLAEMLQERGEGLAAINPQEAQMLKDAGGSGEPLPGTKGLGVEGGPIRSYIEGPGVDAQASSSNSSSSSSSSSSTSSGGGYGQYAGGDPPEKPDQGDFETRIDVIAKRPLVTSGGDDGYTGPREGDVKEQNGITYIFQNGSWQAQKNKGPDLDGNMHYSVAELESANKDIRLREGKKLIITQSATWTGDTNFEEWFQENKSGVITLSDDTTITLEDIDKEELKKAFQDQMILVTKESDAQTADLTSKVINLFNDGTFSARGKRVRNQQGEIIDIVPTTFEDADTKLTELYPDSFGRLSESQKRAVLQDALEEFSRIEAFTLTMEDVDRFTRPAPDMGTIDDITATDIATVTDAIAPTVGTVDDVTETTLDKVLDVASDAGELADVIDEEDALIEVLKSRVAGDEPSVAEIQLKRGTEQNLKALLATTAGVMDPTKLRQTRNMWMDIQQIFTGQKAELRAAEQVQAEQNLLAVLKAKGTREASIQIANMEKDIQMAVSQGNLDQARKIKNQQAALTLVTVQAEIEKDVRLANLDKERIIAIEEGKMDLATKIANLEKEILIAKVNAQLSLDARRLDDALSIAAYQGEQALAGVEVEIDLAEMKSDLTTAGFELQKDLALMDRETKLAVARLVGELKAEQASADRNQDTVDGLIGAIATVGAAYLKFNTGI